MALKFCANLSFMFQESASLIERYDLAKQAGFKAVECAFPYDHTPEEVVQAKTRAGVQQILINAYPGNWNKGDRGLAAVPGREFDFKSGLEKSIEYAKKLDCQRLNRSVLYASWRVHAPNMIKHLEKFWRKISRSWLNVLADFFPKFFQVFNYYAEGIHIMSGVVEKEMPEHFQVFKNNLKDAAKMLSDSGIVGVIEPINKYSLPNYFLNNYQKATSVIEEINSPNIKLQLDLFHLQQICGNITRNIEHFLPLVGHIQIAQVPDRNEPNTPGEINFKYVFSVLEKFKYDGWIGLEYTPKSKTVDNLNWITEFGYSL